MEPPPVQYVTTSDGVRIAFATFGQGSPVLFASNILGDVSFYATKEVETTPASPRPLFDDLATRGWRIIAYDLRGMGASTRDVVDFSIEALRRDLEALVDGLELDRFALAARDRGSPIAIDYAAHHPENVRALVLLDPWTSGERRFVAGQPSRAVSLVEGMAEEEWHYFTLTLANVVTQFKNPDDANALAGFIRRTVAAKVFAAYRSALQKLDVSDQLDQLNTVPTVVVHDRTFPFGSFELAQEVGSSLHGARFATVNHQEELVTVVDDFLRAQLPTWDARTLARDRLTLREVEVLRLIAGGHTNQQIADELVISLNTVLRHVTNILTKTESKNRAEAAAYAIRQGLL